MFTFLAVLGRFARAFARGLRDPEFRSVGLLVLFLLVTGTVFYTLVEGWSALDSLFFSVTTLTTVGYGNLVPETDAGKVFTIVYIFLGVGTLVTFAGLLAKNAIRRR